MSTLSLEEIKHLPGKLLANMVLADDFPECMKFWAREYLTTHEKRREGALWLRQNFKLRQAFKAYFAVQLERAKQQPNYSVAKKNMAKNMAARLSLAECGIDLAPHILTNRLNTTTLRWEMAGALSHLRPQLQALLHEDVSRIYAFIRARFLRETDFSLDDVGFMSYIGPEAISEILAWRLMRLSS